MRSGCDVINMELQKEELPRTSLNDNVAVNSVESGVWSFQNAGRILLLNPQPLRPAPFFPLPPLQVDLQLTGCNVGDMRCLKAVR